MITGECPNCGAGVINLLAGDRALPVVERLSCEECHQDYWLLHSRWRPEARRIAEWTPGESWDAA